MNKQRDWQVILLGGASGVGKTSVSYRVARHYEVGITEVDDFQVILERMTTPEQYPLLHYWRTNWAEYSQWSDEAQLAHFIRVCREVFAPALEVVIGNHIESRTPLVLEGDFILPELAVKSGYGEIAAEGQVRAVFIYEDEAQIAANYVAREDNPQPNRAHSSWLYSEWLREECARLGVPAIPARPWGDLLERAIAAIDSPPLEGGVGEG